MDSPNESLSEPLAPGPPLRYWRSLRFGALAAWDSLGMVCAGSFTVFVIASLPVAAGLQLAAVPGWRTPGWFMAAAGFVLFGTPVYAGCVLAAWRNLAHDETSYGTVWEGVRRLGLRAASVVAVELVVSAALGANVAFYLPRGGMIGIGASVLAGWALAFWWMTCIYHLPLLAAYDAGTIAREGGGPARLSSVYRNGLLLTLAAPIYSGGLLLVLLILAGAFAVSGVGLALLGPGLAAFITTRATRDQLARFGALAPDPDPDMPVPDDPWKLKPDR